MLQLKEGKGLVKVNGKPLSLVQPEILRFKVYEPLLILGLDKFGMLYRNAQGGDVLTRLQPTLIFVFA